MGKVSTCSLFLELAVTTLRIELQRTQEAKDAYEAVFTEYQPFPVARLTQETAKKVSESELGVKEESAIMGWEVGMTGHVG